MKTGKLTTAIPGIVPVLALILGVVSVSTASTFIRLAQVNVSSLAIAAWRLTLASFILAPFAFSRNVRAWRALPRRDWAWLLLSGVALAVHFYTWIVSLEMTTVSVSVVLVSMAPLFVVTMSYAFLKEPLYPRMLVGIAIAVIGSAVIGFEDAGTGTHRLLGDGLALLGAITVAIYMLIGRRLRAQLSLLGYVFPVYATAACVLMVAALVSAEPLGRYPARAWLWLVLTALIPQILGHSSFNWALGHLPATYVSLAVLAEPVGSTLLAWLVLQEPPPVAALVGGPLILLGIAVATWRSRPRPLSERSQGPKAE